MSLLYRGVDQGLLVHPMAGWKEALVRTALSLPEDFYPVAVVAVGYPGKPEDQDDQARKKDAKPYPSLMKTTPRAINATSRF
jgi:hypothetical protein